MSIIEIACLKVDFAALHLSSAPDLFAAPYDQPTATLRSQLVRAIRVLKQISGNPFYFLQDVQDPSIVYYIGRWENERSYFDFAQSQARHELVGALDGLKAALQSRELYRILQRGDFEQISGLLSLPFSILHRPQDTKKAVLIVIARHTVAPENKTTLENQLLSDKAVIERDSGFKTIFGWRLPAERGSAAGAAVEAKRDIPGPHDERDELVVLSGWASKQQHDAFPAAEKIKRDTEIRSWVTWFETRMAVVIDLQ